MSARSFAAQLDAVAAQIGDVPRHELAVLLRRAAVRIRSKPIVLDEETEAALDKLGREIGLTQAEALNRVVREALKAAGYLGHQTSKKTLRRRARPRRRRTARHGTNLALHGFGERQRSMISSSPRRQCDGRR